MDGHQYEYQCAKILKSKGYTRVMVTKGSGDQGIDVIAYSGGKKYGIQCKHYSAPVGNFAVQEAFAGAKYYNCDVAVVMTNTTFTPAAKELAKKTGVLLWENNIVNQSDNSFWLTKFIGIFACIIGILGLIIMRGMDNIKLPILQAIELIFLISGGLFAIFEYRNWGASFLSCASYMLAAIMNFIFSVAMLKLPRYDFLIFIGIALISFLRMDYLHNVTNGYHVWKNRFRQFVNDNFLKTRVDKSVTKIEKEEKRIKKLKHTELYKKIGIYAIRNNTYKADYIAMILQEDVNKVNDCISAMIQNGVISMDTFEESGKFSIVMTEEEFLASIEHD